MLSFKIGEQILLIVSRKKKKKALAIKVTNSLFPLNHFYFRFMPIYKNIQIKVGHGGTLDPLATGVLVIGLGTGCRALESYLAGPKRLEEIKLPRLFPKIPTIFIFFFTYTIHRNKSNFIFITRNPVYLANISFPVLFVIVFADSTFLELKKLNCRIFFLFFFF